MIKGRISKDRQESPRIRLTIEHLWSIAIHHYEAKLFQENKIIFVDYYSSKNYMHVP